MTYRVITGFETGTVSLNGGGIIYGTNGTFTSSSAVKRTGNYSIKGEAVGTAAITRFSFSSTGGDFVSDTIITGRFYMYFEVLPDTLTRLFRGTFTTGTAPGIYYDPADSKVYPSLNTAGTKLATVLTTGTWYRFDYCADSSGSTVIFDMQLDGLAATQKTFNQASQYFANVYFGMYDAAIGTFYVDDLVIDNTTATYPIGAGFVLGLTPESDGTHNAGTDIMEDQDGNDIGAVTAYNLVNTLPMDSTTYYIRQRAIGTGNYAEVNFANTTQTTPVAARALVAYRSVTTTANSAGCIVIDEDATVTAVWGKAGALADYSESSLYYKRVILPNPAGGWDTAAVNALIARVGYSSDIVTNYAWWAGLLIEVAFSGDYTLPSTATTIRYLSEGASISDYGIM